jgi:hypothetical protein
MGSEMITASLNLYRDLRDASSESAFFQIFGSMIALGAAGDVKPGQQAEAKVNPRELPYVKEALAAIDKGGYPEAMARIGALVGQFAGPIPLYRLELTEEFVKSDKVLSKLSEDEARRLRSEAGVMVLLEPERTMQALPRLLSKKEDRERVLEILEWGMKMEGITRDQLAMGTKIYELLEGSAAGGKKGSSKKKARKE